LALVLTADWIFLPVELVRLPLGRAMADDAASALMTTAIRKSLVDFILFGLC
jgi:hypothetical protein